ncbi:response regulator [Aliiroseovarius crassostreae]|uniref:hybrid sensor histidine kinase/response regulator transcription factor n=1 Tax=Aliiroseovarius crassostreae TaxID=154981 RepID=UPI0021B03033|nr:two-component regulator propeller domain-containing protein [Aliiroseovarius crassostreae]UWQ01685.1 response regulator [Aliiroseovarius crassostreae]
MRELILGIWFLTLGLCQAALGDTPKMARQLTIDDGLSQSTVHAIYPAHDGRMWFATGDGISIFDGARFSYLYRSETPNHGLQTNYIFGLKEDLQGRIWVATLGGGVSVYSQSAEFLTGFRAPDGAAQTTLLNDTYDFAFEPDGAVWVTTGAGVVKLPPDRVNAALKAAPPPGMLPVIDAEDVIDPNAALRLLHLKDGRLLVGTQARGLLLIDDAGDNIRPIRRDNSDLSGDRIMALFADDQDQIWIGTEEGGLNLLDPSSLTVSQPIDLPDNDVESISQGQDGRLWFGTWSHGIFVHDPVTGDTVNYRAHPGQPLRLGSDTVIALTAGKMGRIWAGTYDRGVSNLSQYPDPFETYFAYSEGDSGPVSATIWSMTEGVGKSLWVGSKKGLDRLIRDEKRFERVDLGKGDQDVRAILPLGDHLLLALRRRGLHLYDWRTKTLTPVSEEGGNALFHDRFIRLLLQDQHGQIWVGTHSGVFTLDENLQTIRHLHKDNGALPHSRTRGLYEGPEGNIWIGTSGGLTRFNPETGETQTFSGAAYFDDNDVRAIYCLPDGRMLVGTQAGITILSKDMERLDRIGRADGLPNETIYSLLPDQQGQIWITTNNGLARYSPSDGDIAVYKSRDGLQGAEFNFNAYTALRDGTLAVGGVNGLSLFHPDMLQSNHMPPRVSYIQLDEQGRQVTPAPNYERVSPATLDMAITVAHYTDPVANRLRWRLDPVDTQWQEATGSVHKLRRENLQPGSYDLRFQGISAGNVTGPEQVLSFSVSAPLYLRWYAWVAYLLLLVPAILFIPWLRNRALQQRTSVLEAMVQEKTRKLVAADKDRAQFYARAAHEIRTPISLIKAPLQSIEKTAKLSPQNQKLLTLVTRAVARLTQLSEEMSEGSRQNRTDPSQHVIANLDGVIEPILSLYQDSAALHGVRFQTGLGNLGVATVDLEALELITHNLLSNAIRHTPRGGAIEVQIALENQVLKMKVSNTASLSEEFIKTLQGHLPEDQNVPTRGGEIVGALVQRSGADIHAAPDPATITLRFPARHTRPAHTQARNSDGPDSETQPQILIVEDDRELRHYLTGALGELGKIHSAASCSTARRMVQKYPLHLIICDVMLPDGSGFDLIREIKECPETSHIQVLFLTALSGDHSMREGLSVSADDYLTKPFDIETLIARIRLRLNNYDAIRTHVRAQHTQHDAPLENVELAPADERLRGQIDAHLLDHLDQPDFSVDDLARLCALSKRSLQRKLTLLFGQSFSQLLSQRRVEHAATLLRRGMAVKEVYQACGYTHPSSFARRFRQIWGMQPSEFKKGGDGETQQSAPEKKRNAPDVKHP